jgi:hypothetical protein
MTAALIVVPAIDAIVAAKTMNTQQATEGVLYREYKEVRWKEEEAVEDDSN